MTIGEIESEARMYMRDTEEPQRFSPVEVFRAERDSARMLCGEAPESRYTDSGVLFAGPLLSSDGATAGEFDVPAAFTGSGAADALAAYRARRLSFREKWMPALVAGAVHLLYLRDDADTGNTALAQTWHAKFIEAAHL